MEPPLYSDVLGMRSFQANPANPFTSAILTLPACVGGSLGHRPPSGPRTRERWGKPPEVLLGNFISFLIKNSPFGHSPDSFQGLMFTLRGQTLCLLYSEMHPRGTTGTQKLYVKSIAYCCSVRMWRWPLWQPFCNLEEGPRESQRNGCKAPTLRSLLSKYLLLNV